MIKWRYKRRSLEMLSTQYEGDYFLMSLRETLKDVLIGKNQKSIGVRP